MAIGITELVSRIGDDKIKFQNLDSVAISMNYDKGKGTRITFGTDASLTPNGTEELGIVLWLPRDLVNEIIGG